MTKAAPTDLGDILLVEDEALIAFEAEDILADVGYTDIVVCGSFEKAAEMIEARRFAVGVFDVNLNGRESFPLIERFVKAGGNAVITTGCEVAPDLAATLGVVYLAKPYTSEQLVRAVQESDPRRSDRDGEPSGR